MKTKNEIAFRKSQTCDLTPRGFQVLYFRNVINVCWSMNVRLLYEKTPRKTCLNKEEEIILDYGTYGTPRDCLTYIIHTPSTSFIIYSLISFSRKKPNGANQK